MGLPPIGTWDVSKVTNMSELFREHEQFNENLNTWNVSKVTNMTAMFYGCKQFNQPLEQWNVSKVTNMDSMFLVCEQFNQPLEHWNVSKVKDMSTMFQGCKQFNQPLENWNVTKVKDMMRMFYGATNFNQPLHNWNLCCIVDGKFENSGGMFDYCNISFDNIPVALIYPRLEQRIRRERLTQQRQAALQEATRLIQLFQTQQQEVQGSQRAQQIQTQQQAVQRAQQFAAENASKNETQFEECTLCRDPLNNINGPGNNPPNCVENCNDVVSACVNNHKFHRGCILNWCNAPDVDIAGQMGFDERFTANRPQQGRSKCPLCKTNIDCPGLANKEKVPDPELIVSSGGKRRKTRKYRKSAKKRRKSKKSVKKHAKKSKM